MRLIYDSKDFVHHKVLKTLILTYVVLVLLSVPYQLIAEGEQTKKEKPRTKQSNEAMPASLALLVLVLLSLKLMMLQKELKKILLSKRRRGTYCLRTCRFL